MTKNKSDLSVNKLILILKKHGLDPTDQKILDNIVEHYKDIVGEESNIKIIFLLTNTKIHGFTTLGN